MRGSQSVYLGIGLVVVCSWQNKKKNLGDSSSTAAFVVFHSSEKIAIQRHFTRGFKYYSIFKWSL